MNKILRLCAALEEKVKVDFGQLNIRKQSFGPDFYVFAQLRKATYRNTNKYTIGKFFNICILFTYFAWSCLYAFRKYMALKSYINKGPDTTPIPMVVVPSAQTNSWPPSFCSILKHVESIAKHQFSRKRCLCGRLAGRQLNVVCSHIQSLRQPISSHYRPLIRLSDELQ